MHCPPFPSYVCLNGLVEEADDLARDVLPPRLLMVHDAGRGGKDDVAELTRRQEHDDPLLQVLQLNVVARIDDTTLVEAENKSVHYSAQVLQT